MTRRIDGVSEIIDGIDAVLCDQYGVLHDGTTAFDGAHHCLSQLAARRIPIIAVTNSGKSAAANASRLVRFGFDDNLITGVLSSGEVARQRLMTGLSEGVIAPGIRIHAVETDAGGDLLDGLPVVLVEHQEDPELVLIAGVDPITTSRDTYHERLAPLARKNVPAWCANPDHMKYTEHGPMFSSGIVAQDYALAGGNVTQIGKPSRVFFQQALSMIPHVPPERILMIGDSPVHDIAGAAAMGLKTLLVEGGVQAAEVSAEHAPTYRISRLVW